MFERNTFKVVPGTEKIDLGQGLEQEKNPKKPDLLDVMEDKFDLLSSKASEITTQILDFFQKNYKHSERVEKVLKEIDFDYVLFLLRKVVRNAAQANNMSFQDFTLSEHAIGVTNHIKPAGVAWPSSNVFAINPAHISKGVDEHDLDEENLKINVAHIIIHEVIHLLGAKENEETGFTKGGHHEALNEAMTEFLAQSVTRAYKDFTNTTGGQKMLISGYDSEVDCLQALMVFIAKDNQVEIESVIQAFTASYFYDDSVIDALGQFASIGPEAQKLVTLLQSKSFKKEFDINSLAFDEDSKQLFNLLHTDRNVTLKALHI